MAVEMPFSIELRIESIDEGPAFSVVSVLNAIDSHLMSLERRELEEALDLVSEEFGDDIRRRCLRELESFHGRTFSVEKASNGSLLLGGLAIGLAYWILQNTLGETVKEAWKESELNARIKGLLLRRLNGKVEELSQTLPTAIAEHEAGSPAAPDITAEIGQDRIVVLIVERPPSPRPPSLGRIRLDFDTPLDVGDEVLVIDHESLSFEERTEDPVWIEGRMDRYSGMLTRVQELNPEGSDWVYIDADDSDLIRKWFWRRDWLGKVVGHPYE